ncbi:MAG: phospho-sugar mutase [Clostridiales bacterium]|nr:phospho-sugar mutase [Clostridiales bacterium]MDO4350947.1 phospho-sugar mutase [Eubacteriales bacterium]MDY4009971.1 phospho-sugar mutase [Candidatus Limiplasma sp.]
MGYRENYEAWLHDFASDAATVSDLQSIAQDEKEIEDRFYKNLSFGTAGMRGVLGAGMNRMNVYTVRRATQGLADYLSAGESNKRRGVVIGYDSRRMSAEFAMETARVLCANGIQTYLFDALRPVALLSFGVRHLNAVAGVVITASHNPPQYNGYKVYGEDGAQLGPEAASAVTEKINALSFTAPKVMDPEEAKAAGLLHIIGDKEVDDDYIALVKTLSINPEVVAEYGKNLKIVYTPIHGSGNVPVRRILREIGLTNVSVVKEQEAPDPNFSTVKVPNPEDPAAFTLAIKLANEVGADAIFGTDPDCDRLGVAVREKDGSFRLLTGNQIGCLMLHYILSSKKAQGTLPKNGAVVKSIVSTELARAICKAFQVDLFDTLTGFKFIGEKIQQFQDTGSHTFLFGFEESYGYLSSTFVRDKDGVNASLLIAEAACYYAQQGKTLCDVMAEIFATYGYYLEHVESTTLPGIDGLKVMADIMAHIRQNPPKEIGGIKVARVLDIMAGTETEVATGKVTRLDYPESDVLYFAMEGGHFVCVRPSGTEPKIKLYVNVNNPDEAKAKELLAHLTQEAQKLLK